MTMKILTWRARCPQCNRKRLTVAVDEDRLMAECTCTFTAVMEVPPELAARPRGVQWADWVAEMLSRAKKEAV